MRLRPTSPLVNWVGLWVWAVTPNGKRPTDAVIAHADRSARAAEPLSLPPKATVDLKAAHAEPYTKIMDGDLRLWRRGWKLVLPA
jgi:hypothetical protein